MLGAPDRTIRPSFSTAALAFLAIAALCPFFIQCKGWAAAETPAAEPPVREAASAGPNFAQRLKASIALARAGKIDEALAALAALAAGRATGQAMGQTTGQIQQPMPDSAPGLKSSPDLKTDQANVENRALSELAAGGVAQRAGRTTDALSHYSAANQLGGRLADYARYFQGTILAGDGKDLDGKKIIEARRLFVEALKDHSLPQPTEIEIRARLGDLAAAEKNWRETRAVFRPLLKRLKGGERYPGALLQLYRAERGSGGACKLARDLYSKYPTLEALGAWGPDLRTNKIDGKATGCSASGKLLQARIRRLQWGGEAERAGRELQGLRSGATKVAMGPAGEAKEDAKDAAEDGGDEASGADEGDRPEDASDDSGEYSTDALYANYLVDDGRVDEALKLLLAHYQEQRGHPSYLMLLAKAAARVGEYGTSVGAYYRAYELRPRAKEAKNALFQAAFMSYQFQDYDGATRKFEEFIQAFSRTSLARDARWHLAWIHYLRGDFSGAYQGFALLEKTRAPARKARRRRRHRLQLGATPMPDSFGGERAQYWKAMCLVRMGRAAEAVPVLQKLARDPAFGYYGVVAYYRLASLPGLQGTAKSELAALKKGSASGLTEDELRQAEAAQAQEAAVESEPSAAPDPPSAPDGLATGPNGQVLPPGSATTAAPAPEASGAAIVRRFDRARALALAGFPDQARAELAEIERRASSVADRRALMVEYRDLGNWYRASMLGEIAFGPERLRGGPQKERDLWEFAYPRAFNEAVASAAKQSAVAGHLVWSIMRAESHYRQDAYSPVGALGLMQLMPFTGKKVADLLGTGAQFQPRSLLDPEVNIRLGARYLQRLSETFSGSIPLIAAGYNAGPHRVQAWLKSFGLLEMDEFIEHIPFMETRNYCKKVVRNYQVYSLLYDSSGRSLKWLTKPVGVTFDAAIPTREAW